MKFLGLFVCALIISCTPKAPVWELQTSHTDASFRGISAIDENICWVSGSNGTLLKTENGGQDWKKLNTPEGADSLDFRDIEAFSSKKAIAMSAGPGKHSRLYKTDDGGNTWTHLFTNTFEKGFFTAVSFWDEENGIVLSDPVEGTHYILKTSDGGSSWSRVPRTNIPQTDSLEYGFAASGTNMRIRPGGHVWIGTGGSFARVFYSSDYGSTWKVYPTPMKAGKASEGIFSILFTDDKNGIAVGGNYQKQDSRKSTLIHSDDGGVTWKRNKNPLALPYQSCIAKAPNSNVLITVGRSGSHYSSDNGLTWKTISKKTFYTMDFGLTDQSGWAAGPKGTLAKLTFN